mmetsp:Transcript_25994/g.84154  ORF Transcript_25994/g.84154 Transcript_25994/m.84154 type:complete len:310 (-) Transcript_25994:445-1374(-)
MVDFFMQITFMVALLTLDQRRRLRKKIQEVERRRRRDQDTDSRRNGRDDVPSKKAIEIPEVPSKNTIESSSSSSEDYSKNDDTKDSNDENAVVDQHASFNKDISDDGDDDADVERKKTYDDGADRFWATQYPAFLFSVPGKVFVLCASFTVLALGIVGCVRFEVDMDLDWSLANPSVVAIKASCALGDYSFRLFLSLRPSLFLENFFFCLSLFLSEDAISGSFLVLPRRCVAYVKIFHSRTTEVTWMFSAHRSTRDLTATRFERTSLTRDTSRATRPFGLGFTRNTRTTTQAIETCGTSSTGTRPCRSW